MMKTNTRRHFLQRGDLAVLGPCSRLWSNRGRVQERGSRARECVARLYGRVEVLERGCFEAVKHGSRTKCLPVSRLGVRVGNPEAFRASFEQLTKLTERVLVEGNTVRFAFKGGYYVVENRVA